ncbi:MAG: hypothetical protein FJ138_07860, partial [Deltaproteobacteria bacterium]|nr:hypothetical protein [Deltaproteobacteria bacterium]
PAPPTLSLASDGAVHVEAHSLAAPLDALYLNPAPEPRLPAAAPGELVAPGWREGEWARLRPLRLLGPAQEIELAGALVQQSARARARAQISFNTLSPLLRDVFQRLEGRLDAELSAAGPLDALTLSGQATLYDLALLAPRSQVIGDIRLMAPLALSLDPIEGGGLAVNLPSGALVRLLRDEGEVTLSELSVALPRFSFERLAVGFGAQQLEANLPGLLRVAAQLKNMRFVFERPSGEGERGAPELLLSGRVDILRGLYSADVVSSDELNQGFRNNLTGRTAVESMSLFERSPLLRRLRLDLELKGEDELLVRNQVGGVVKLNLDVQLDLAVKGYLYSLPGDPLDAQLSLLGEARALEGSTITYANKRFDVLNGRVAFGGGLKAGGRQAGVGGAFMRADLEATHTFRIPHQSVSSQRRAFDSALSSDLIDEEVTLEARVLMPTKESAPQVKLDLVSQSGASKIEVAALVLTGRYPNNLNAAASTQPATEMLLAPVLNLIERPLEDSLGLNLNLTPDTVGAGLLFVDLNKSFSRRLRLYARTLIGEGDASTPQSFGVDYKLNNLLSSEFTREQVSQLSATSGRLRLRLSWD